MVMLIADGAGTGSHHAGDDEDGSGRGGVHAVPVRHVIRRVMLLLMTFIVMASLFTTLAIALMVMGTKLETLA